MKAGSEARCMYDVLSTDLEDRHQTIITSRRELNSSIAVCESLTQVSPLIHCCT